tara:strand:+ start:1487 stop:2410 length:924 start_codon:yes stop_codon:yes gene_type:complete
MNSPSFFIIGAPKCGTSALAKFLSDHKHIYMSKPKEPHFFSTDIDESSRLVLTLKHYLSLFKKARQDQLCGEASVWYFYSKNAVKNIYKFNAKAKIIIMYRNPSDMIYSLHNQMILSHEEDVKNFENAWKLSWERENGSFIPKNCRDPKKLYYHKIANYFDQLQNVYKYFSKEQVKIISFENFQKNNLVVYKEVLQFLNIEYDNKKVFERINERKVYKNEFFSKLNSFRLNKKISILSKKLKEYLGISSFPIWSHFLKYIQKISTKTQKANSIDQNVKKMIDRHYEISYKNFLDKLDFDIHQNQNFK